MSLESPNHLELKLIRESVRLSVSECAEIFKVSTRAWNHWEAGRNNPPSIIVDEINVFHTMKSQLLDDIYKDLEKRQVMMQKVLPWYSDYQDFVRDYPKCSYLNLWRIYQSVVADIMLYETTVTLSDKSIEIDTQSHLYKWLTRTTEMDARIEEFERNLPNMPKQEPYNPELDILVMVFNNQLSLSELTEQQLIMASIAYDNPILLPAGKRSLEWSELVNFLNEDQRVAIDRFKKIDFSLFGSAAIYP
ncbi:YdiL family protein [Vibrio fluvialis]|nr:YdiL family protein [Vibrio fluvialis]MBY7902341.1 YdiL family protein [Vibrio fluvialis]